MTSPMLTCFILISTFLIYLIHDGRALMLCCFAPFCKKKYHLNIFNDILPSWDANQTWLVFTIAGVYGAFPVFFGEIMSKHYSFFLLLLMLFIIRGASIEFYIKSSRFKNIWLYALASSSFLLLLCQVGLCTLLLDTQTSIFFALFPFIFWFHLTQACCFLFPIKHINRLSYVLGLLLSSQLIFSVLHISIWNTKLTSVVFIIRLALLISFLAFSIIRPPSKAFGRILLFYVFFSNALFILHTNTALIKGLSFHQIMQNSTYSSFFIINIFSIILLPIIATGLSMIKKLFLKNIDEIIY
jgi:cytochrome bd-type quinol oxidase subunit 2